jgi:hypothetical protein
LLALAATAAAACDGEQEPRDAGGEVDAGPVPSFPANYAASYTEMRDCRPSHEHALRYIRVLASQSALEPYAALSPEVPYPAGAVLLKLEYDDEECAELVEYTSLEKLEPGENPAGRDWLWQRVSSEREVIENGAPWTCINCHTVHCAPPNGYDLTCAEEL